MIIVYNVLSTITDAQFKDDIVGLITGNISAVNQLSAGCDQARTTISGTYPTGKYTLENATTNTFSKIHSVDSGVTDYFRLTFGTGNLTSISLASGYTSGTDTLINSSVATTNMFYTPYSAGVQFPNNITIVITPSCLHFTSNYSGVSLGIFDIGVNGITATYTDSMKMALVNTQTGAFTIPYSYVLSASASTYAAVIGTASSPTQPTLAVNITNSPVVCENPVFLTSDQQGNIAFSVYGLVRTAQGAPDYRYNTAGVTRQTGAGYSILTE